MTLRGPGDEDLDALLEVALRCARGAGEALRAARRAVPYGRFAALATKSSRTDLVTAADCASEEFIVATLARWRPGDGILAEEGATVESTSGITWVVDPLDGTTNFVYGYRPWAVAIAARDAGGEALGVVHDPERDETFTAIHAGGARLNDRPLHVGDAPLGLAEALIGTGFGYGAQRHALQGQLLAGVLPKVRDVRRGGSAALDLCSVAAGRLDGYYEAGLAPWDLAAGAVVAREAGAAVSVLDGVLDTATVVVSHPAIHEDLLELLVAVHAGAGPAADNDTSTEHRWTST